MASYAVPTQPVVVEAVPTRQPVVVEAVPTRQPVVEAVPAHPEIHRILVEKTVGSMIGTIIDRIICQVKSVRHLLWKVLSILFILLKIKKFFTSKYSTTWLPVTSVTMSHQVEHQLLAAMDPAVRTKFFSHGLRKLSWLLFPDHSCFLKDPVTSFANKELSVQSSEIYLERFEYQPDYIVHRDPWKGTVPPIVPKYSVYLAIGIPTPENDEADVFASATAHQDHPYTLMWACLFHFPVDVSNDEVESIRSAVIGQMASITDMVEKHQHKVLDYPVWISTSDPPKIIKQPKTDQFLNSRL